MARVVDHLRGRSAWREAGTGPPVLFLHGLGGSRSAWEPQLEGLSDRFRCVAWDLPGYGDAAPITPLTFPAIARAAVELLDELGIERADVVGRSFGGQQALHLALRHPARVGRLVLADTSAGFDATRADAWKQRHLGPLDAGLTPAEMAPMVVDRITAPGFTGRERDRTIAAWSRIPPAGLRAAVECVPTHDATDRLGDITSPALVVVGELDEETPTADAETLAHDIPDAELSVIPGVGHLTPAESPELFNHLVQAFLTR